MSLLTPSFGLLFWMVVSFVFVFAILGKYGFPVITKMVDERRDYISQSLEKADKANLALEGIMQKSEEMIAEARKHQSDMIKQATAEAGKIIQKAKDDAEIEGRKKLEEAIRLIDLQKQKAIGELRSQVALLSVGIAEKILRRQLDSQDNHDALISQLIDEIETSEASRN
ncbi:MAG: F0F1 ATP synthase subunit B [Tannerella sp.]|jgi:F-type H+-transporting ATPase subunit b|nr:F0F1 ATP synthase subunit B [Tannerella sp.]